MDNIPYQAVSMAVILRDYTSELQYINDEHKRLVDIADTLWNASIPVEEWNDNPDFNYKALYKRYGVNYWQKVMKDISAIDNQIDAYNVKDLKLDYQDMLKG